jgi:hypothetical protein
LYQLTLDPRTTTTNTRQDYLEQQKTTRSGVHGDDERPWRARGGYGGVRVLTFDGSREPGAKRKGSEMPPLDVAMKRSFRQVHPLVLLVVPFEHGKYF